jgi:hypothetical protein
VEHECGVTAVLTEFASQISISAQHEPWPPTPAFASLEDGFQPSTLPCVCLSIRSKTLGPIGTYLAIGELQIPWTLGIAIPCAILGAGFVSRVFLQSAVCIHGNEVQGTIEATWQVRHINVESKLLVSCKLEHLFKLGLAYDRMYE